MRPCTLELEVSRELCACLFSHWGLPNTEHKPGLWQTLRENLLDEGRQAGSKICTI